MLTHLCIVYACVHAIMAEMWPQNLKLLSGPSQEKFANFCYIVGKPLSSRNIMTTCAVLNFLTGILKAVKKDEINLK